MKRLLYILALATLLFASCEKEPATPPHVIPDPVITAGVHEAYIYPATLNTPKEIPFTFKDVEPDAQISAWTSKKNLNAEISVDRVEGTGVASVTATGSFGDDAELVLTVINGSGHIAHDTIALYAISVTVSTSKMEFPKEGAVGVFNVSTNVSYTVVSSVAWATVEKTADGRWSVTVNANEVKAEKQGVIMILDAKGVKIASFPVSQEAATQTPNEKSELETILAILYQTRSKENNLKFIDEHKESLVGLLPASSLMTINGETHVISLTLYRDHPGPVPEEVGDLKYLKELIIDGNNFNETLPENMANLKELRRLNIWRTHIEGEIPEFLSTLPKLFELSLEDNYFTGNLPLWLTTMPELISFSFNRNCLDGKIDSAILETVWWNTIVEGGTWNGTSLVGWKCGEADLFIGQKEGHKLWI